LEAARAARAASIKEKAVARGAAITEGEAAIEDKTDKLTNKPD
jgi:hypothetical protein